MKAFRYGQEAQSGTIRRDPSRSRGRRDDSGIGEEVRGASPDGAAGDRELDPAGTKKGRSGTTSTRAVEEVHRPDYGRRPRCAEEAEAHGASHLLRGSAKSVPNTPSASQRCGATWPRENGS